ncbi:MAG: DNA/RNA nuclease SfsA [Ruminococcaceae bacterium]|nr:DNA/RNA nuclease SfsA [Oscillospiraceae bacterium]
MRYAEVTKATFLARPNRFIAHVELGGEVVVCHVKNTGRCRELLVPGAEVWLEKGSTPGRKTAWDLIAVRKGEKLINMDAQAPNKVFAQWAAQLEPELTALWSEYTYGQSRLDFCLETAAGLHLVEVKGVTLEEDGHTRFPDAPTERGVKHLQELMRAVEEGYRASVVFVIQMEQVKDFAPNDDTHPAFGEALRAAAEAGVQVVAVNCRVAPDSLEIIGRVPVVL